MDKATSPTDVFQADDDRATLLFYMETKHVSFAKGKYKIQHLGV